MYEINPNILQTPISDGKILLLEPKQGLYFELNEVSVLIYQSIQDGKSKTEVINVIIKTFAVSKNEAEADLNSLIQQFFDNNIIKSMSSCLLLIFYINDFGIIVNIYVLFSNCSG